MANEPQSTESPTLSATVERCLMNLRPLSLALDTYGNEDHAVMLHEVIAQLQTALPAPSVSEPTSMDFIVNATFKVSRQQVAGAMARLWQPNYLVQSRRGYRAADAQVSLD